jgi:hypothetical protein
VLNFTSVLRVASLFLALFIYGVALAAHVRAQETQPAQRPDAPPAVNASPTPSPSPAVATTTATDNHDLSITANVTARELLFEVVPNPKVEFTGQPRRDTVWEAERTNLPAQVQPGVTYRDIGIRLKITSVFADIERIVAEALGEIPASDSRDDAPQTPEPNTSAAPQTSSATQTSRAAFANRTSSAQTAPARRKNNSHAPTRRGRH